MQIPAATGVRPGWAVLAVVALLARGASSAELTLVDEMVLPAFVGGAGVAVTPDGVHVYTVGGTIGAGPSFNLTALARDPASGLLSFVESETVDPGGIDGLYGVQAVALSPDGRHVYTAAFSASSVVAFERDSATGALDWVQTLTDDTNGLHGIGGASDLAVSPDGANVYVAAVNDDSIVVFARDADTGELVRIQRIWKGLAPVEGLRGARNVAVSPDGETVYACGNEYALVSLDRDPTTGLLTPLDIEWNGVEGVGAVGGCNPEPDPGGSLLYTAAPFDQEVGLFARAADGSLDFLQALPDGNRGAPPLPPDDSTFTGTALVLHPGGERAYVANCTDDSLAVFARDPATGMLAFEEAVTAESLGLAHHYPCALALSPDGRHLYATLQSGTAPDDAGGLAIFAVPEPEAATLGAVAATALAALRARRRTARIRP